MAESAKSLLATVAMVTLLWLLYIAWLTSRRLPPASPLDIPANDAPVLSKVIHPVPGVNFSLRDMKCTYHACFDIDACRLVGEHRIGVYIYPSVHYYTPGGHRLFAFRSRQFDSLIKAIRASPYYTADPSRACVFLPDIDTLNPHAYEFDWLPQYLYQLPAWSGNGANHLLFEAFPVRVALVRPGATILRLPLSRAMVASASFTERTYRSTFDIALPTLSAGPSSASLTDSADEFISDASSDYAERPILLASAPPSAPGPLKRLLRRLGNKRFLVLNFCQSEAKTATSESRCSNNGTQFNYPDILSKSTFCLLFHTQMTGSAALIDAISRQCIPVILTNTNVFPFHELIEWNRFSIRLNREADLFSLPRMLTKFSRQYVAFMRYQMRLIYQRYFSSPAAVALAVLQVLNDRVFPYMAPSMQEANGPPPGAPVSPPPPLFHTAPLNSNQGYTAVVLTNRHDFDTLSRTLSSLLTGHRLGLSRHLRKIVIVWNGQKAVPPTLTLSSIMPSVPPGVTLEIIRSGDNRLTNRYLPYDAIETDAVLSLDDNFDSLLPGELLLAYHVWLENPDCIVGFPPVLRNHSLGGYSEELSMVLTSAAFYHKQYGALFHDTLPVDLIDYIDSIGDCEDIAMNCLVANLTGKGPIKVGPRLKFPSNRSSRPRSACLTVVKRHFGIAALPVQPVAFRADPVLFKTAYANWSANADYADLDGIL